ncbi:MAG: PKD domain-containing protein [Actinomycetota bacterium]|nr:PKD domain-containing protein [Actinomycetota bacterium]
MESLKRKLKKNQIPPPVAKITVDKDPLAGINTEFDFSALESSDVDGDTLTYEWILWDGTKKTGGIFDMVFTEIGDYEIKLIVSDGEETVEDSIMINIVNQPPNIVLSEKNISCNYGDTLEISAEGTEDPEGDEVEITWTLPDGSTLKGKEIEFAVSEIGESKIVVVATDGISKSVEEISITAKESVEQLKESCEKVTYDDLLRNPDEYYGERIYIKAEIVQKISDQEFHVNMTKGGYGYYDDRTWLYFETIDISLIENDIIEVWGLAGGNESYETVLGATTTIPLVFGQYVNLVTKAGDR